MYLYETLIPLSDQSDCISCDLTLSEVVMALFSLFNAAPYPVRHFNHTYTATKRTIFQYAVYPT